MQIPPSPEPISQMRLAIPQREFGAYIFDCDGTLVDSMPLHLRAWRASFEVHGAPFVFQESRFYARAGVPDRAIVSELNLEHGCDLDADSVHEVKLAWFIAHLQELQPVVAVAEIVRSLVGRKPMAVASGSDLALVEPELIHVGLRSCFEIIITPADVKRGKPAPDMFLLAAERMGVAPEQCLVFEDGQAGLDAAKAAGMETVFVPSAP